MNYKIQRIEKYIVTLLDAVCALISIFIAYTIRFGLHGMPSETASIIIIAAVFSVSANLIFNFPNSICRRTLFNEIKQTFLTQCVTSASLIICLYIFHVTDRLSRLLVAYFSIINGILMVLAHLLLKAYLMNVFKNSSHSQNMLIISRTGRIELIIENILNRREWSRIIVGAVNLDANDPNEEINGVPVVVHGTEFVDYIVHNDIDEVFLDLPFTDHEKVTSLVQEIESMGVIVYYNIDAFDMDIVCRKEIDRVGRYAVVTFSRNIFSLRQLFLKRILDILGSIFGMVLFGLAALFIAPAIMLESPGPILFRQTRVGKNGRKFTFYKFRSMYMDAEERKKELMAQNEVNGLMFKIENDPRITKIGHFIRKTSLDELPQFWNVLKGDSLVGTRPPTMDEFDRYEPKHKCRLSMKPGITGMWQVSGRSDIKDFDEVIKLDMQYIDDWTIFKDIMILFKTVDVVLKRKGSR